MAAPKTRSSSPAAPPLLVLASASTGRLATLRAAGIEPLVIVSAVDEQATLADATAAAGGLTPAEAALVLARAKAADVAAQIATQADSGAALVLGCDSLFELDGVAYGKPASPQAARERWAAMSGRRGTLHTGHWLIDLRSIRPGGVPATAGRTVSTEVSFAHVTPGEVDAYVATGEPLACAGAFTLDGYGGAYIAGVIGDPHNVVGLSLPELRHLLADLGVTWHSLWRSE